MKRFPLLLIVLLTALGASCSSPSERVAALAANGTQCGTSGQAGAPDDAGIAGDSGAADAGIDSGSDAGPPPPVAYAYMTLRAGQSDSGEQATFAGSPLDPWVPVPLVQYWHINSTRGITLTTFGPLGGKFGTELSNGKTLAAAGLPIKMSTVFISSTRCTAALPGNPGYNSALHLSITAMVTALPAGAFPVPLNLVFDNGQSDAQASNETQAAYFGCLNAINADLLTALPTGTRLHWVLHRTSIGPGGPLVPSLGNVNASQDQFCAANDCSEVDTAPYAKQADGLHYTAESDVAIGQLDAAASVAVP